MKVLVIGSGGREHALTWKIAKSPKVNRVYCAPGNAGIGKIAECLPVSPTDIQNLLSFAKQEEIGLTVVGPEGPLALGITDAFRAAGLRIFGPSKAAAQIEASKITAKRIMEKYGIPTAEAEVFTDATSAIKYIRKKGAPLVVKADGLAAGKGVIVAATEEEAIGAVEMMMKERLFGTAGERVIIEECLNGEEASFLIFTDGKGIVPMPLSKDHKRAYDGDRGPNTGGMGAYSPVPTVSRETYERIVKDIVIPTIQGLAREGIPYEGVLYTGLMMTPEGPKVLEFNCRFGDPEAQPLLMRLESDIVELFEAVIDKRIEKNNVKWRHEAAVCVILASGGYPNQYQSGKVISGLEDAGAMEDVMVFHAGTALDGGHIVTAGGRVLGVTALGEDIGRAIHRAYEAAGKICFEGMHYRKDIGRGAGVL